MDDEVETLTYDYNYNMFLTKTMLPNLTALADRQKVVMWLKKLSHCNRNIDELKLRNDFLFYLVSQVKNGELKEPFTENPRGGSLPPLSGLLTGEENRDLADHSTNWANTSVRDQTPPLLYQNSPDGGSFLAAQPIPRCGAFCYLAVVTRDQSKN